MGSSKVKRNWPKHEKDGGKEKGGGGEEKGEVGTSLLCSVPKGVYVCPRGALSKDNVSQYVKVVCSSSTCQQSTWMHPECFRRYEEQAISALARLGRGRGWSDVQRRQNVWVSKMGFDLVFKFCECNCGKGSIRKDLEYAQEQLQKENQAVGGGIREEKKKKKKEKQRPELNYVPHKAVKIGQDVRVGNNSTKARAGAEKEKQFRIAEHMELLEHKQEKLQETIEALEPTASALIPGLVFREVQEASLKQAKFDRERYQGELFVEELVGDAEPNEFSQVMDDQNEEDDDDRGWDQVVRKRQRRTTVCSVDSMHSSPKSSRSKDWTSERSPGQRKLFQGLKYLQMPPADLKAFKSTTTASKVPEKLVLKVESRTYSQSSGEDLACELQLNYLDKNLQSQDEIYLSDSDTATDEDEEVVGLEENSSKEAVASYLTGAGAATTTTFSFAGCQISTSGSGLLSALPSIRYQTTAEALSPTGNFSQGTWCGGDASELSASSTQSSDTQSAFLPLKPSVQTIPPVSQENGSLSSTGSSSSLSSTGLQSFASGDNVGYAVAAPSSLPMFGYPGPGYLDKSAVLLPQFAYLSKSSVDGMTRDAASTNTKPLLSPNIDPLPSTCYTPPPPSTQQNMPRSSNHQLQFRPNPLLSPASTTVMGVPLSTESKEELNRELLATRPKCNPLFSAAVNTVLSTPPVSFSADTHHALTPPADKQELARELLVTRPKPNPLFSPDRTTTAVKPPTHQLVTPPASEKKVDQQKRELGARPKLTSLRTSESQRMSEDEVDFGDLTAATKLFERQFQSELNTQKLQRKSGTGDRQENWRDKTVHPPDYTKKGGEERGRDGRRRGNVIDCCHCDTTDFRSMRDFLNHLSDEHGITPAGPRHHKKTSTAGEYSEPAEVMDWLRGEVDRLGLQIQERMLEEQKQTKEELVAKMDTLITKGELVSELNNVRVTAKDEVERVSAGMQNQLTGLTQSVDERERALALVRDGMVKLMELREEEIEHLAVKVDEATDLATKGLHQLQLETQAAKKVTTSLKDNVLCLLDNWERVSGPVNARVKDLVAGRSRYIGPPTSVLDNRQHPDFSSTEFQLRDLKQELKEIMKCKVEMEQTMSAQANQINLLTTKINNMERTHRADRDKMVGELRRLYNYSQLYPNQDGNCHVEQMTTTGDLNVRADEFVPRRYDMVRAYAVVPSMPYFKTPFLP